MYQNLQQITINAQVGLNVLASVKVLFILNHKKSLSIKQPNQEDIAYRESKGQEIYNWYTHSLSSIVNWLQTKSIKSNEFYDEYLKKRIANYLGYYSPVIQPQESNAFGACLYTSYIACHAMMKFDKVGMPSDVVEFTSSAIPECLEFAQQASENPEAEKEWQDQIISRLLQDHSTDDPEDFGENISRAYIEELLGEQLPF